MLPPATPRRPHLRAAVFALLLCGSLSAVVALYARHLETRYIHALAWHVFPLKNHAVALQRAAFEQPDLLPLYGSSELVKKIPDKASEFFHKYPSDFAVSPVGRAGTTSLIILQKLAAVGTELRGRKVAISLSPSWFVNDLRFASSYAGNFSALQASELAFSTNLDPAIKRDAARRMLAYEKTFSADPLLGFALRRLAGASPADRALYALVKPLGFLQNLLGRLQDHVQTAAFVLEHRSLRHSSHRRPRTLDWPRRIELATLRTTTSGLPTSAMEGRRFAQTFGGDAGFLAALDRGREWNDLELLLRALRELGAEPLLLSMPLNGAFFDSAGISPDTRARYYTRLQALADRYRVPLVDFRSHEDDPKFFVDHHDHLSVEGWMYFDAALDAFYHGREVRL